MPILTTHHVSRAFGLHKVLLDVSLAIEPGERIGLIGSNGSGKSTLGRILAGLDTPDGGTLATRRDADVAYLAQEPELDPARTAYEEAEMGLSRWREATARYDAIGEALGRGDGDQHALLHEQGELSHAIETLGGWNQQHRVTAMLEALGVSHLTQKIGEMSGGEKRRVALARILVSRPALAILDEPTNHLDADTAEWLENHLLHDFAGALVLITHDRYFLDSVVTRVLELDRGEILAFEGNYERYLDLKADRMAHDARVESNQLNILRREREWLSHKAPARTTKQKARIQRAGSLEDTVQANKRVTGVVDFRVSATRGAQRVLELKGLTMRFGERTLFEALDFTLMPGMRVGVIGRNGSGKTTLLNVLLGRVAPTAGEVTWGPNSKVMYFDQQRAGLDDTLSVIDNVYQGSDKILLGDTYVNIHSYLERFLFDGAKQRQVVSSLSGGERARLALAKMLRGGANVIILDEPTNDLDLVTLAMLEELLTGFDGCALVVTHDRYFLNRTATSILSFESEGRVVQYAGQYEDYRVQHAAMEASRRAASTSATVDTKASVAPVGPLAKKARSALTMAETKELAGLPDRIAAGERTVAMLEAELNDPTLYASRGSEVASLTARLHAARTDLETWMARWELLETRKEQG